MGTVGGGRLLADSGTLGGSALASWTPVTSLLIAYAVVVVVLWALGSASARGPVADLAPLAALQRIGRGLTRVTGIPGWAAAAIGQSLFALLVAGVGFYSDVAWHIALGRDEELFTAPHTAILLGLIGILSASVLGTVLATLDGWESGWRIAGLRVPWSMLPLGALGVGAVSGFPMDEVWHAAFGIDVTMWSPTHMLMILGASFTGLAGWLVLADAGVASSLSGWARFLHGFAAWLTLQGLVAGQGEFSFGVPQFAHIFHPLLIAAAAGLGLVAIRLVLGRGRALLIAAILLLTQVAQLGDEGGPVETRHGATFLASALAVELAAAIFGVERRSRFAVAAGVGIGTLGLAGEWIWNSDLVFAGAHQPWETSLLPLAAVVSAVAAVGAGLLGAGFASAFRSTPAGRAVGRSGLAVGFVLVVAPIVALLPRGVGDVSAEVTIDPATSQEFDEDAAFVTVALDPPSAADDAHWFQASAWQGGGLVLADMVELEPGVWRSETPVPIDGFWKTLVRLHRNDTELMAIPIWFPADPEIDEPEIPAVDKQARFEAETRYLLRETEESGGFLPPLVHGYLALTVAAWFAAFVVGMRRISGEADAVPTAPATDRTTEPV